MHYTTLESFSFSDIHAAFLEAFSDYVVPMRPTEAQLVEMFRRRGFDPRVSVGAIEGDRLVGFTVNGIGPNRGTTAGYDSGSGVVPSHRRQGIAREMMERSCNLLRAMGAQRYVLEVIESNRGAATLYESCGFVKTRDLTCWTVDRESFHERPAMVSIQESESIPDDAVSWRDWESSWQNSTESIKRAGAAHVTLVARSNDQAEGYAVVFPDNGDVAQFAVRPQSRRTGIATALIEGALSRSPGAVRMINIDGGNTATEIFLATIGARMFIRQIEMSRDL